MLKMAFNSKLAKALVIMEALKIILCDLCTVAHHHIQLKRVTRHYFINAGREGLLAHPFCTTVVLRYLLLFYQ